jgi:hypothetical protein
MATVMAHQEKVGPIKSDPVEYIELALSSISRARRSNADPIRSAARRTGRSYLLAAASVYEVRGDGIMANRVDKAASTILAFNPEPALKEVSALLAFARSRRSA